jgi:hypothetical protein
MSTATNATPEQMLRAALKSAGFNARKVTVRRDHSTLRVTLRDAAVPLSTVKAIADQFMVVRRDERSGEILCGGNTFLDVHYLPALVEPVAAAIIALLTPAAEGVVVALPGGFRAAKSARRPAYMQEVRVWGAGFDMFNSTVCGISYAAERIAIAYLDACASTPGPTAKSAAQADAVA